MQFQKNAIFTNSRLGSSTAQGFTIVEILVVLAMIGILAAIVLPSLFTEACKEKGSEIHGAIALHQLEEG